MDKTELISIISNEINTIRNNNISGSKKVYQSEAQTGENEFCFFIKPELTLEDQNIQKEDILGMILDKIDQYHLEINNAIILPAAYLHKHNIIANHYGVINSIAKDVNNLSDGAKSKFKDLYGTSVEEATALGGLQFIEKFPFFSPTATDYLWQNSKVEKLGGGAYAQKLMFDSKDVFLINGFHPRQLEHFTQPNRLIIVFTLVGDTQWKEARNDLIGATNPVNANEGSIRKTLLDNKEEFGLQNINSSWNGVHLSAGPVEGLIELIRYNSDYDAGEGLHYKDFSFVKKLIDAFGEKKSEWILSNPEVEYKGKRESVFDLTEEMNSKEAIERIKLLIK